MHQQEYESAIHKAIRKAISRKMTVTSFISNDGQLIHNLNGYNLTVEQVLELDSKGELTSWGITEFARRRQKDSRN